MKPRPLPAEDPMYPSSDGKPLAENDWQLEAILSALDILRGHFEERPDVYVSGDLLIYYEEGNPRRAVAPDVFVVLGADKHKRMVYKLWEEPKAPDFVLEVASKNTWKEDVGPKRATYAGLGVREYWLFDPKGEYWSPRLQGLTLEDGAYRPLGARVEAGRRTLRSTVLGMDLWAEDSLVRFRDVGSGEVMRTWSEHRDAYRRERAARERLEARIRELEARDR